MMMKQKMSPKTKAIVFFIGLIEVSLFVTFGWFLGFVWAVLILLGCAALGVTMIKRSGVLGVMANQKPGQIPDISKMLSGSFTMICGMLMLIPGYLTSLVALICLIPWVRKKAFNKFMNMQMSQFSKAQAAAGQAYANAYSGPSSANDPSLQKGQNTIDGEFWHEDDKK